MNIIINSSVNITEKINNTKDLTYIRNIELRGINFLHEKFKKDYETDKKFIDLYSLIYLSSKNFCNFEEINYLKKILIENDNYINNLLLLDNKDIHVLQQKLIDKILNITFKLDITKKIEIYNNLFKINNFNEYIFQKYWDTDIAANYQKTIIGNIISSLNFDTMFKSNIEIILDFIEKTCIKIFKEETIIWFENVLLKNLDYKKTFSILVSNKKLSSFSFQNKLAVLLIELYKRARIFSSKNIDDINTDILYDKNFKISWDKSNRIEVFEWKKNDQLTLYYSLFTRIFIYTQKILELSILPSIEKVNSLLKSKYTLDDLIELESNSVRWRNSPSFVKNFYINRIRSYFVT